MDHDFARRYLQHRLPQAGRLEIIALKRSYPGISRETWLVDATWQESASAGQVQRGFVFRMDTPGGSVAPVPLMLEHDVYVRLAPTAVPVACVLWREEDPAWLCDGRPFYVRAKVEGVTTPPGLNDPGAGGAAVRRAVAKEHATALATIHAVDWAAHDFASIVRVPTGPETCAVEDLAEWEVVMHETQPEPFPVMDRVIAWLRANLPPAPERVALVKGNNGIGEEIWQGTRIVAMSDWELAHLGDPAEDFAWIQGVTALGSPQEFMAFYRAAGGSRIDPERLSWYSAFRALKAFICLQAGGRMFQDGRDRRVQLATLELSSWQSQRALAQLAGI